jgi:hypothetical protein
MEAPPYTDTILLEANRKSSAEYLAGNNESKSSWTNDLGSGIKLDIGDTISVHSAYISEIGNEDATIEIKGRNATNNLGERQSFTTKTVSLNKIEGQKNNGSTTYDLQTEEGNYGWEYTESENTHTIRDDSIHLTHSYYKCAQGDNYISLPRGCGQSDKPAWWDGGTVWAEYNSTENGKVSSPNPYRLGTDYSYVRYFGNNTGYGYNLGEQSISTTASRTEISNDGKRFTLFVRKNFKNYVPEGEKTGFYLQGERDPALMDFIWYKKTVEYKVSQGFNSPANVASQITNKMNDSDNVRNTSYGEDFEEGVERDGEIKMNNINMVAESNTYELFPCATAWFIKHASELWFDDEYNTAEYPAKVPFKAPSDVYRVKPNSNVIGCHFTGTYNSASYTKEDMFTDGYVYPGWIFLRGLENNGSNIDVFDPIKGFELHGIKELNPGSHPSEIATYLKFGNHTTNDVDVTIPIRAGDPAILEMSNEHIPSLYESCYSTVGYLRPEIQEAGRAIHAGLNDDVNITIDGSFNVIAMTYPMEDQIDQEGNAQPSTILSEIPWTEDNLEKLKKLFEAEALYPELFNWDGMSASQKELINVTESTKDNVSVNTMRFLHMNDKTQEEFVGYNVQMNGSITDVDFGEAIPVSDTSNVLRGMRLYQSDADTEEERLFPSDTFVTSKTSTHIYVSNPHNASVDYTDTFLYLAQGGLGNDRYSDIEPRANGSHTAGAVFFDYNPARKDIREGEGKGTDPYETLTYGFAKKFTYFEKDYIGFYVGKYQEGTLPQEGWFNEDATPTIPNQRCIGFDKHFNAYSTCAILLTNGYASLWGADYNASTLFTPNFGKKSNRPDGTAFPVSGSEVGAVFRAFQQQPNYDGWLLQNTEQDNYDPNPDTPTIASLFNEIYCGANQPALQFSSDSSRFSFVNLHTAELIGTNAQNVVDAQDITDSSAPCFKLNKRLSRLNYSPNFIPYNNVFKIVNPSDYSGSDMVPEKDNNITPYAIMDAQAGIFIEDYGCDEANWSQSLWELLGFTYDQFHNVGSRLQRFNDTSIPTSTPTTNAVIRTEDLSNGVVRGRSSIPIHNTLEVNYPFWRYDKGKDFSEPVDIDVDYHSTSIEHAEAFPGYQHYPIVVQSDVKSTTLEAVNLPRKMLSPIYLIKSDLLNPQYIGGREGTSTLPVIGVVDKSSGYGDFYTGARDSTIFTNTIPRTIQNVKTSIVDADGSDSRVDDSCCVIYKVTKQIRNNSVVLQNILNPPKK